MRPTVPSEYFVVLHVAPLPFSKLGEVYHASIQLAMRTNVPVRFEYGASEYTALPTSVCPADCALCAARNPKLAPVQNRPVSVEKASKIAVKRSTTW